MLAKMPTWLILEESPALIGLANMPLEMKDSVKK